MSLSMLMCLAVDADDVVCRARRLRNFVLYVKVIAILSTWSLKKRTSSRPRPLIMQAERCDG